MKRLAYRLLTNLGWTFHGQIPDLPKMIVIGAPHTSNWDFVLFMAALHHYAVRVRYMGKHTLFRWPLGYFFRALGGIPVDRSQAGGMVGQVARVFDHSSELILVIAPEGTRKRATYWRSGFLHIAQAADVPVVLASLDYASKRVTIGLTVPFDGDVQVFMEKMRAFYAGSHGLNRGNQGPVAVREEIGRG